jgi:hypothetical protein
MVTTAARSATAIPGVHVIEDRNGWEVLRAGGTCTYSLVKPVFR